MGRIRTSRWAMMSLTLFIGGGMMLPPEPSGSSEVHILGEVVGYEKDSGILTICGIASGDKSIHQMTVQLDQNAKQSAEQYSLPGNGVILQSIARSTETDYSAGLLIFRDKKKTPAFQKSAQASQSPCGAAEVQLQSPK